MYDINDHFKIKPFVLFIDSFNSFLANVPIWYPLKTSNFLVFSGGKNKKIDDRRVNFEWNINCCEKPMFPFDTLWKPLVFLCFQGGKIGKLTTEGLFLNEILTSVRSQCSHLIPSKKIWFSCVFRGKKRGKLTAEGLILNGILTNARSQCSHLCPLKTPGNQRFSSALRGYKMGTLAKNGFNVFNFLVFPSKNLECWCKSPGPLLTYKNNIEVLDNSSEM